VKWSYSAHQALRRCQRQFVFNFVVASHNARNEFRRRAFQLKQLQQLNTWQGSLIHDTLAKELPPLVINNHTFDPSLFTASAKRLAELQFGFSKEGKYRLSGKSSVGDEYCALYEHEFGIRIPDDWLFQVESNLKSCFDNLSKHSRLINHIWSGKDHQFERMIGFNFNGITLNAQLDLKFINSTAIPVILDWKITRSETSDYSQQVLAYGYIARRSGMIPYSTDKIELIVVNLLQNKVQRLYMGQRELLETEDFIYQSVSEMRRLIGIGGYDDIDLNEISVANKPGTCALCNFKALCAESLIKSGQVKDAEFVQERLI
jgi:hypothetical protein